MTNKATLIHRIDKNLKIKAQQKAKAENRSLSNWIRNLIARECK
jgi:predicted HicB family RNase H-like nuclease